MSQSTYNRPAYKSAHYNSIGRKLPKDNVREKMVHNNDDQASYFWKHDSKPIEWGSKSQKIIAAMRSEKCWDIIDPNKAPINCTNSNREMTFDEVEINIEEMTDRIHDRYADEIEQHLSDCLKIIQDDSNMDTDTKCDKIYEAQRDRSKSVCGLTSHRERTKAEVIRLKREQQIRRDKFDDKIGAAHKGFRLFFHPDSITGIDHLLNENKFREAWKRLEEINSINKGGAESLDILMERIQQFTWNLDHTAAQNIYYLNTLTNRLRDYFGQVYGDQMLCVNLRKAVTKSSCARSFKAAVASSKDKNETFQETCDRLLEAASSFDLGHDYQTPQQIQQANYPTYAKASMAYNQTSKRKKWCKKCRVDTHNTESCFKTVPCTTCGILGHGHWQTKFCPKAGGIPHEVVKLASKFTEAHSNPLNKSTRYSSHYAKYISEEEAIELRNSINNIQCIDDINTFIKLTTNSHESALAAEKTTIHAIANKRKVADMTNLSTSDRKSSSQAHSRLTSHKGNSSKLIDIIIDSGATSHMIPTCNNMLDYTIISGLVSLGDKNLTLSIEGIGSTPYLTEILHVPKLSFGLISISKLDEDNYSTVFKSGKVYVFDLAGNLVLTGTMINNLYHLDREYFSLVGGDIYKAELQSETNYNTAEHSANTIGNLQTTEEKYGFNALELLHNKWGHASSGAIKKTLKLENTIGSEYTYDQVKDLSIRYCEDCLKGKMKSSPLGGISEKVYDILEKVGIDWKGPFSVRTQYQETGFFLLADQRTHYLKVYLCKSRSQALECLEDYLETILLANNKEWKILQADTDSSFISKQVLSWLSKKSIRLQLSAPYKHSQNGMVERDMQFVVDKARAMMSVYDAPKKFWGNAIVCASTLINMTHTPNSTNKTPYEMVHGVKPDVSKLIPFYAPGVYHLTKDERQHNSWKFKAEPCRFLGYDSRTKHGAILLKLSTNKIITRDEYSFDTHYLTALREGQIDTTDEDVQDFFETYDPTENQEIAIDEETDNLFTDTLLSVSQEEENDYFMTSIPDWFNATVCIVNDLPQLPPNPKSVNEALAGPQATQWWIAIQKELEQMETLNVFTTAEQEGRGMKVKIVLRNTYDNEFNIKYKARLVGCGYSQKVGIDYLHTYAPTISTIAVYTLLHIAAHKQYKLASFDVSGAFLESINDYENFAWLPPQLFGRKLRVKVSKAIYGEKQSARLWHEKFDTILKQMGFLSCPVTNCLYKYTRGEEVMMLTVHVDDGLIAYNSELLLKEFHLEVNKHLTKLSLLSPVLRYLGVNIEQDVEKRKIFLSQSDKIDNMVAELLPDTDKQRNEKIPMSATTNLKKSILNINNSSLLSVIGKLRFLADRTRIDILTVTGELGSKGATTPSDEHIDTAIRCINYLRCSKNLTLDIGELSDLILFAFTDSSYNPEGDSKSRMGGALFLGKDSGSIFNYSKNTSIVTQSSTHAEIMAIDEIVKHIVFLRDILYFLGYEQTKPTKVYTDSKSAKEICELFKTSHKTSSINMRINYVKQCIDFGLIELSFIDTKKNIADVLTKPLAEPIFTPHITKMMKGFNGILIEDYISGNLLLSIDKNYLINIEPEEKEEVMSESNIY